MEDEIYKLSELDKVEKNGSISNNDSKIAGIIDKSIHLTTSSHTKLSFMKDSTNNYNFTELLAQNKILVIKIAESKFPSKVIRDIISTFFLAKICLSKQLLSSLKHFYYLMNFISAIIANYYIKIYL